MHQRNIVSGVGRGREPIAKDHVLAKMQSVPSLLATIVVRTTKATLHS